MKRACGLLMVALFAPACTGALTDGPLQRGSGAAGNGDVVTGGGGAGSGLSAAGATGTAGVGDGTGVAGAQGTSNGGAPGDGAAGTTGACSSGGLPLDVQTLLSTRCAACHGNPPLTGVPTSLTSYASLTSPSKSDPTRTNAQLAVARMQSATMPMPPAPLMRATAAEIATLDQWVTAGAPPAACPGGADGGVTGDAGLPMVDPFAAAPVCTSNRMWTSGNHGSSSMNPGLACISCHSRGEGPRDTIAGTLYPTAHEPDLCDGVNGGSSGAQVVIVGADGVSITLTPNAAGNFSSSGNVATPYQAKVVYAGRERAMIEPQTSGDCNNCHTQDGAMPSGTTKAPGRILLP